MLKEKELQKEEFRQFIFEKVDGLRDIAHAWGYGFTGKLFKDWVVFQTSSWGITPEITISTHLSPGKQSINLNLGTLNFPAEKYPTYKVRNDFGFLLPGRIVEKKTNGGLFVTQKLDEGTASLAEGVSKEIFYEIGTEIDKVAKEKGLIDPTTGQRLRIGERTLIVPEKFRIDDLFETNGAVYPLEKGADPDELLELFDRPNDLFWATDPYSGEVLGLCHIKDKEYVNKRHAILNEILLEKGLTPVELISSVEKDPKTFMPLFESIRQELESRLAVYYPVDNQAISN